MMRTCLVVSDDAGATRHPVWSQQESQVSHLGLTCYQTNNLTVVTLFCNDPLLLWVMLLVTIRTLDRLLCVFNNLHKLSHFPLLVHIITGALYNN